MKFLPVNIRQTSSLILIVWLLSGCGFQLRGNYLVSPKLQTLTVTSIDTYGELTRVLKQHLARNEITVAVDNQVSLPELRILKDRLDRRTLSVFENGQVAEYELTYTVQYELRLPDEEAQRFQFELNRDYQDDPDSALAKSRELSLMLKEMRQEAADKIVRDLARIQL